MTNGPVFVKCLQALHSPERVPSMRTLLVNLTRFGDLLQTQPVISGLRQAGHEPGLVCLDNFVAATALLNDLAYVRPFPGARFMTLLDADWRAAALDLATWARHTADAFKPDVVTNLTAALSVRLVAKLLAQQHPQPRLEGFCLDNQGFGFSSNTWGTFLLASSQNRGCSPFNLVDLFWKSCGLGDTPRDYQLRRPDEAAMAATRQLLAPAGHSRLVAFQLGASENRRRWPVASFSTLGRRLHHELGLTPVLLGSKAEAELGRRYAAAGGAGLDLIGATSLPELAAVLLQTEFLVTNDTGTMHLAAGLDVPVAAIFLATAQPWDTGPYKAGALCLEPDLDCHPCPFGKPCPYNEKCRQTITADGLFELLKAARGAEPGLENEIDATPPRNAGARVWRTEVEEAHFMGLRSLSGHENADRTQWVRLQRHVYRHFLDQKPIPPCPGTATQLGAEMRQSVLVALDQSHKLLTLLAEQGKVLAHDPMAPLKKKFMATWQRVQGLWDQTPALNVLGHLWLSESQDSGRDMPAIHELLTRYAALTRSWLDHFESGTHLE